MPFGVPPPGVGLTSGSPTEILPGTGTSVPAGLEAILEFNGMYLNDRSNIDSYIINSISGLDDADVRDDREVNPQQHGETAFDAFYGGRTITLTGYIRAYTLAKLRDMQQGMKQAFAPLTEMDLVFHSFNSPETDALIPCRKGAPLQMTETQPVDNYFRRDFLITLRASNPRFLGLLQKEHNASLGVVDEFAVDSNLLYTKSGSSYTIASGKLVPPNTSLMKWVRNDLPFNLTDSEYVIKYEPATTFTGSFGRGMAKRLDDNNFIWGGVDAGGALTIGKVDGGSSTTLHTGSSVPARSVGTPYWIRVRVVGNQVTVEHATSDPRVSGAGITTTANYTLAGADAVKFGSGISGLAGMYLQAGATGWRFDDMSLTAYNINGTFATVSNAGNFTAQPEVTIMGPITNPILTNVTSGQALSITDTITQANPYKINIANRTMKDSAGVNKFSKLAFNSDWLELEPGGNVLSLNASGISPSLVGGIWYVPEVSLVYRDAWI